MPPRTGPIKRVALWPLQLAEKARTKRAENANGASGPPGFGDHRGNVRSSTGRVERLKFEPIAGSEFELAAYLVLPRWLHGSGAPRDVEALELRFNRRKLETDADT